MKTVSFIGRKLSVGQRQSMERIKYIEQTELQAKQAFNQSINETIKTNEKRAQIDELEDLYKFRLDKSESFTSTISVCQVLDSDELNSYVNHTRY